MNFFKLVLGSTDQKTTIGFELRAYPGCGPVWPLDVWTPINAFTKRALENVIDLSDEIVANLPRTTAQMRPPLDTLSDVIGAFDYPMSAPPPLLSARARALIDRLAAGSYQSIPAPKFWDVVKGKELDNSDHAFVNITRCIDGWDKSKSEINKMIRKDGTVWYALGCPEVLNEQAVKDAHLWRDSVTNTVLCSETFKEEATSMDLTNLRFIELRNA